MAAKKSEKQGWYIDWQIMACNNNAMCNLITKRGIIDGTHKFYITPICVFEHTLDINIIFNNELMLKYTVVYTCILFFQWNL